MPNPLLSSVLPVLRNLPENFPREPLLPGLKRRPMSWWPLLLLIVLSGVLPFFFLKLFASAKPDKARVETTGRVTQVEVIDAEDSTTAQSTFIKYRFLAGQQLVYGSALIPPQEAPRIGDTIPISYDPKSTKDNRRVQPNSVLAEVEGNNTLSAIALSILVWIFVAFMIVQNTGVSPGDLSNWRRARGLYRKGELATGRVQFVRNSSGVRSPNRNADYEIVATYKVEGVRFSVATRCDNQWLINQLAPETQVVVAHDPLKPERAVILEPFAF